MLIRGFKKCRADKPLDKLLSFPHIPRPHSRFDFFDFMLFNILIDLLLTLFVLDAILLIFIVLMQRPKSEGLGAAFGGGMTENLFGAQTTNVLANFTRWLGGIFFGLALILSILYAKQSRQSQRSDVVERARQSAAPVVASPTPAPAASVAPPAANLTGTVTNAVAAPTAAVLQKSAMPQPSPNPAASAPNLKPAAAASPRK